MADSPVSLALSSALSRPEWKAGGELTASELNLEQKYQTELLRHHLRFLHGWGILCGLTVVPPGDPKRPWLIRVCPGYGVNPCGDEIAVAKPIDYDLQGVAWRVPAGVPNRIAFVGARFVNSPNKALPAPGHGCGCGCGCSGEETRDSRLRDTVEVSVSWQPWTLSVPRFDLCTGQTPPCPPCPPNCDLPLAAIRLPASTSIAVRAGDIDDSVRVEL